MVVEALHSPFTDESEFGFLIKDCKLLLNSEKFYSVQFIGRLANTFAHSIARA